MSTLTKAQKAERAEAIAQLRDWIKPGDTVYTILEHVSRSGMQREIRVVVPYVIERCSHGHTAEPSTRGQVGAQCDRDDCDGTITATIDHLHPNYAIARALGLRQGKRDGLIMGGCGMDMGFHLVYVLSATLYGGHLQPDVYTDSATHDQPGGLPLTRDGAPAGYVYVGGYRCLGKGACPSNYHVNHRDTIRCEGTTVYNPDGPDTGSRCWDAWTCSRGQDGIPEGWPRAANGAPLYAIEDPPESGRYVVCPTCQGRGSLPNPAGPERFDLLHTDGYAIRHRWL